MVSSTLENIRVAGIRCAVPSKLKSLHEENLGLTVSEISKLEDTIGIKWRRVADFDTCASDLCELAGNRLIDQLGWDKDSIDVLIFVTQSPDYIIPSTACVLQNKMGLAKCFAFDVNLGCSGYVYGLWTAASILKTIKVNGRNPRALLLAGDISTKQLKPYDRSTIPLFGDAGSATALEFDENFHTKLFGVFGTNGDGSQHLIIKAGGHRQPLLPNHDGCVIFDKSSTLMSEIYDNSFLFLDGHEVFSFTLKTVPKLLNDILDFSKKNVDDVDYFLFHQANGFMLKHLIKKLNLPINKVPVALENYGNTSSASIPLTICSQLNKQMLINQRVIMIGFGVGWSWGALSLDIGSMVEPLIDEYFI